MVDTLARIISCLVSMHSYPKLHPCPLPRLDRIEQFASRVKLALQSASGDPSTHLSDPVNAYQLVNRFLNGWASLYDDVYEDNGQGLYFVYVVRFGLPLSLPHC